MLKGFRDFILRGNVVELAVAVVIGTAFTAIVSAFSDNIINPLIASVGGADVSGLGFHVFQDNPSTFIDFGAVITAAINFLIIAAIVYFVLVMPMNKLNEAIQKRKGIEEVEDEPASLEANLLEEIRDLLQAERNGRHQA
ncbi:Large-conductance mechanosensitive channel [Corynebacterium occultum]|uniref:Large-conductance mechanosensitive channel n=1 Tax=Corynebacterium occultum TaxID=2675219 RepID=A0A6B8W4A6_9CORY|nr:large conductance mechanosensitive channel protein MscL [Corynebacterium occultum]QGU06767.1 Large-conductance mechanosensitive channel [Corynebacterium occultum]